MGGGGLVSSIKDYLRFAQMLLNGGELDGVRILQPSTVKLMMSNHLADTLMTGLKSTKFSNEPRPGLGYGFDGAAVTDPRKAGVPMGEGTYLWDGWAGTWFWIDPENELLALGMMHVLRYPDNLRMGNRARTAIYEAIQDAGPRQPLHQRGPQ